MIKLEETQVLNWEAAIRGMRNPMNSWDKSDSGHCYDYDSCEECPLAEACSKTSCEQAYIIGPNDHKLMMNLAKAGTDHAKYRRQIIVSVDITAPLYWWKEFDTYKVGTVANSCSTMHKIHAKEFELEDFSHEHLLNLLNLLNGDERTTPEIDISSLKDGSECFTPLGVLQCITIPMLNRSRELYLETKDKKYWWQMIQLLPSSYNQKRTVTMNYENLANMYKSRKNHKLDEWRVLCDWVKDGAGAPDRGAALRG